VSGNQLHTPTEPDEALAASVAPKPPGIREMAPSFIPRGADMDKATFPANSSGHGTAGERAPSARKSA
jgi:hypothetical protein